MIARVVERGSARGLSTTGAVAEPERAPHGGAVGGGRERSRSTPQLSRYVARAVGAELDQARDEIVGVAIATSAWRTAKRAPALLGDVAP